jgi:voltage-gated potassium channel
MTLGHLQQRLLKQRRFRQILVLSVVISLVMGFIIVPIEANHPETTIKNTSDGLWWSLQTLTTVGYGDTTPVTAVGRILGLVMQLVGTVMFGILLAMIGTTMSRGQEEFYWDRLFDRLNRLEEKTNHIAKTTGYIVKDDFKKS